MNCKTSRRDENHWVNWGFHDLLCTCSFGNQLRTGSSGVLLEADIVNVIEVTGRYISALKYSVMYITALSMPNSASASLHSKLPMNSQS